MTRILTIATTAVMVLLTSACASVKSPQHAVNRIDALRLGVTDSNLESKIVAELRSIAGAAVSEAREAEEQLDVSLAWTSVAMFANDAILFAPSSSDDTFSLALNNTGDLSAQIRDRCVEGTQPLPRELNEQCASALAIYWLLDSKSHARAFTSSLQASQWPDVAAYLDDFTASVSKQWPKYAEDMEAIGGNTQANIQDFRNKAGRTVCGLARSHSNTNFLIDPAGDNQAYVQAKVSYYDAMITAANFLNIDTGPMCAPGPAGHACKRDKSTEFENSCSIFNAS